MNYYPFHLGDYAAHTAHLEPMEDLAYRRMLDAYYLREAPLPADPAEVARLVRMRQNMADVEAVLREFFVLGDDGWCHARCDAEIAHLRAGSRWALDVTNATWSALRDQVFSRDGYQCVYCGEKEERLECDHVFPLSRGGVSTLDNLATSCKPCNRSKGAKTIDEWRGRA